tara:strand:- start:49 stop:234 length:186 start_codon:yes stop_codon:yes gene_type:complete
MTIKTFTTFDGIDLIYEIVNGNLSYKIDGTDWQDFILEDRRAYSQQEYAELLSLLEDNSNV